MPAFRSLDQNMLRHVAARLKPQLLGPDQDLCMQGDEADSIWLLHEGCVVLQRYGLRQRIVDAPGVLGATLLYYLEGDQEFR